MTSFFKYEELSWPEVDKLPRNTPLVLPLGEGYPFPALAQMLGNPPKIGLLPAFPLLVFYTIVIWLNDKKTLKAIARGISVK